jgi:hypothetical protein
MFILDFAESLFKHPFISVDNLRLINNKKLPENYFSDSLLSLYFSDIDYLKMIPKCNDRKDSLLSCPIPK